MSNILQLRLTFLKERVAFYYLQVHLCFHVLMLFLICFFESVWKICAIEHKTRKEVVAKEVVGSYKARPI